MKKDKYLNTFLATSVAASMVTPQMASAASMNFSDIENSYAKQNINYLTSKGIIDGVGNNKFAPKTVMNREQFAALLGKTLGIPEKSSGSSFKDVSPWAQKIVGALEDKGLVAGLSKGHFGAKNPVNREQMAVFYVRAMGYEKEALEMNLTLNYKDAQDVSPWARPLVAFAESIGFISGYPDGTFKPKQNALRQDVAALSYRYIDPENTDPEIAGQAVTENKYIKEAKKLIQAQKIELTITSGDVTEENASKYIFKGTGKADNSVQLSVSYLDENNDLKVISKTAYPNKEGVYQSEFDLSKLPDGIVTLNAGYWGDKDKSVTKEIVKTTIDLSNVTSFKKIDDISLEQGKELNLPQKVTAVFEDGSEKEVFVSWDKGSFDNNLIGEQTIEGTVHGTNLKASVKVIVKAKNVEVSGIVNTKNTEFEVTLNRKLGEGENLIYNFNGQDLTADKVSYSGNIANVKVPQMTKDEAYTFIIKNSEGVQIFEHTGVFDLRTISEIRTVPVGYAKKSGEDVTVKYLVVDEEGKPLEGARIRLQIQYLDKISSQTKVIEEILTSDVDGYISYTYTSFDARRDKISAISMQRPSDVRSDGKITVDWSFAQTGLIEVNVTEDMDKGEGVYNKYEVTFKDDNGNPLPKNTKVYVYLGEDASVNTKVKSDFTKVNLDEKYAEATLDNFEGKAELLVTDNKGKTIKPMFYYKGNVPSIDHKEQPENPRVQAGATTFVKQIPTISLSEKTAGKVPVGDETVDPRFQRIVELEAIDQFGDPYLGVVKVGLEEAMDDLNETKFGSIKYDIDVDRNGDALDLSIGEKENKTGEISLNFGVAINSGKVEKSIANLIIKGGSDKDKATFVAFIDDNRNGFDETDQHKKVPVEFEDVNLTSLNIEGPNKLVEGTVADFVVSMKDQFGETILLDENRMSNISFQIVDESGKVVSNYTDNAHKLKLETDFASYQSNTANFSDGLFAPSVVDNNKDGVADPTDGGTLYFETYNPTPSIPAATFDKFVVRFESDKAGKYTLRAFLDDYVGNPEAPDYLMQKDEIHSELEINVEGPVLTTGEVVASSKYSQDKKQETIVYSLKDQMRGSFKAKDDLNVEFEMINSGDTAVEVVNEDGTIYMIGAGETKKVTEKIIIGQSKYTLRATPKEKGTVSLVVKASVKDKPESLSTSGINWVSVDMKKPGSGWTDDKIFSGKVIAFKNFENSGLNNPWYVLQTSIGNILIEYVPGGGDSFVVDNNSDDGGFSFDEQLTVGDEISYEFDFSSSRTKHTLNNK